MKPLSNDAFHEQEEKTDGTNGEGRRKKWLCLAFFCNIEKESSGYHSPRFS